jgi:UPF0716 protein FxsA
MLLMRLPVLPLLLLPFLELWLMIEVGSRVGGLVVIGWLIAMIFLGINLLRYLGASSMMRAAQDMRAGGGLPAQALADGLFKAVGAVLLIIPGFITDLLAILCFIPVLRRALLKRWLSKITVNASANGFGGPGFDANSFRRGDFTAASGNVYEHQASANATEEGADIPVKGLLIDQESITSERSDRKND